MIHSKEFNWSEFNEGTKLAYIEKDVVRGKRTNKNPGVSNKKLSSSLRLKTQGEHTVLPKFGKGWGGGEGALTSKCR